jgi:N,N'-diacetyllegionaminate synthase
LRQLVEGIRFIERAQAHPVDKAALADELSELKRTFGKSIVAARDLTAGQHLTLVDLAFKKPGTGISAARVKDVLARRLKRAVAANSLLSEDDFE